MKGNEQTRGGSAANKCGHQQVDSLHGGQREPSATQGQEPERSCQAKGATRSEDRAPSWLGEGRSRSGLQWVTQQAPRADAGRTRVGEAGQERQGAQQAAAGQAGHLQRWTRAPGRASSSWPGAAFPASPPASPECEDTVHLPKSKGKASRYPTNSARPRYGALATPLSPRSSSCSPLRLAGRLVSWKSGLHRQQHTIPRHCAALAVTPHTDIAEAPSSLLWLLKDLRLPSQPTHLAAPQSSKCSVWLLLGQHMPSLTRKQGLGSQATHSGASAVPGVLRTTFNGAKRHRRWLWPCVLSPVTCRN